MRACLVCDDHALLRPAICAAIAGRFPGVATREAADYPSAWRLAAEPLDLIVTDLDMPGAAPLEGLRELMRIAPQVPVIVITGLQDDELLLSLLGLDVAGVVPKTVPVDVMLAAVALVLAGGRYFPPRVGELLAAGRAAQAPVAARTSRLTDRQRSVLKLLTQGQSNKEIAIALGLSPATVKTHVAQVLAAIDATNRTDAAVKAREAGLI